MTSKPVAFLLADLGVTKTHSRPHTCAGRPPMQGSRLNDNPYSEAQCKTLKYRPEFTACFCSLEDARVHCVDFFAWYNTAHRHSGLALHTPHDVNHGLAAQRQIARAPVLTAAYAVTLGRFVRHAPIPAALPTAA